MTKSKSSKLSNGALSILLIHLMNGAQFVKPTGVELLCAEVMISSLTKT